MSIHWYLTQDNWKWRCWLLGGLPSETTLSPHTKVINTQIEVYRKYKSLRTIYVSWSSHCSQVRNPVPKSQSKIPFQNSRPKSYYEIPLQNPKSLPFTWIRRKLASCPPNIRRRISGRQSNWHLASIRRTSGGQFCRHLASLGSNWRHGFGILDLKRMTIPDLQRGRERGPLSPFAPVHFSFWPHGYNDWVLRLSPPPFIWCHQC